MLDISQDLIEDSNTEMQRMRQVLQLPFDENRSCKLLQLPFLIVTYIVRRYDWLDVGIFIFLSSADQAALATINWASWREAMERYSDTITDDSPLVGVVARPVPLQFA